MYHPAAPAPAARRQARGLSIHWKVPLLMTAVLALGLAGMLGVTYDTLARRAEAAVRDRLSHGVREIAGTVLPSLAPLMARMSAAAADAGVQGVLRGGAPSAAPTARGALEGIRTSRDTALVVELWDLHRRPVLQLGRAEGDVPRPPLQAAASSDGGAMTPIFGSAGTARFWAAVPIRTAGGQIGWVTVLRRVGGPARAVRTLRELTREDLTLYVRNADGSGWVSAPGVPVPAPDGRARSRAGLRHTRHGTGELLAEEAAVPGTPWVMVLEVPVSSVLAGPRRSIRLLAQLSLLLLAAGALVSWWLSRRITRPIAALTRAAEELARGAYPAAVTAAGDEIGRLAASFDAMARQVDGARRVLEQRAEEAQRARAAAEEANRAKTNFLSAMSHELRTPLNAIGGYAQLLEMGLHGAVTPEQREVLRRIERSQGHLLALIEDLLEFAQLEAGRVRFALQPVELAETVAEIEGLVEGQAAGRKVRLAFPPPRPGVQAHADPDKLRQVALNLVVNAIKFTPSGGEVQLDYQAEEAEVRLRVRDTGVGIADADVERIFEPFVQGAPPPAAPASGVGLGLAISRELARGMGGEVTVSSAPGEGSTFTLTLPRAKRQS